MDTYKHELLFDRPAVEQTLHAARERRGVKVSFPPLAAGVRVGIYKRQSEKRLVSSSPTNGGQDAI